MDQLSAQSRRRLHRQSAARAPTTPHGFPTASPTLFREHGTKAETIVVGHGSELTPIARRYAESGCRTIVAAGGDGTVSAVASALVGTQAALGVLPLGTLNHFAKDVGIPLDLDAAVETIINGERASWSTSASSTAASSSTTRVSASIRPSCRSAPSTSAAA